MTHNRNNSFIFADMHASNRLFCCVVTATLSDDEEDLNEKSEVTTETRDTSVVSQTTSDTLAPPEKRAHIEKTSVSEENAAPDEQSKPSIPMCVITTLLGNELNFATYRHCIGCYS